jgi:hypothetical protein
MKTTQEKNVFKYFFSSIIDFHKIYFLFKLVVKIRELRKKQIFKISFLPIEMFEDGMRNDPSLICDI